MIFWEHWGESPSSTRRSWQRLLWTRKWCLSQIPKEWVEIDQEKSGIKIFQDIISLETPGYLLSTIMCAWSLHCLYSLYAWWVCGKKNIRWRVRRAEFYIWIIHFTLLNVFPPLWNGHSTSLPYRFISGTIERLQVEVCWALELWCKWRELLWLQDADIRAWGVWARGEPQRDARGFPGVSTCPYQVSSVWSFQLGSVL